MSFRVSFILLVLVAVVAGYVAFFELRSKPEESVEAPWFYDIGFNDLAVISVTYQGQREVFARTGDFWVFQDTGEPVDLAKWAGIVLLLTGPRSTRIVQERIDNPAEYGLDPPQSFITVTLRGGRQISVKLGNKTPDGASHYGQLIGNASLFLITSSWGDVINGLVTDPPIATPTVEGQPPPQPAEG